MTVNPQLDSYIQEQKRMNFSPDAIIRTLLSAGYDEVTARTAVSEVLGIQVPAAGHASTPAKPLTSGLPGSAGYGGPGNTATSNYSANSAEGPGIIEGPTEEEENPWWVWALIAVFAVIIIITFVVIPFFL